MRRLMYRLMYLFSKPRWDSGITPPEVVEAFEGGDVPPGVALDLGCGTGTNVIYMAKQGREAIGVDFVREAIRRARKKAEQAGLADRTKFHVADVTHLAELNLPSISYALDMGCFHGLNAENQKRYAEGLAALMPPGGRFMLYAIEPRAESGISFGIAPEDARAVFEPYFEIVREQHGAFWERNSTWFWMTRKSP